MSAPEEGSTWLADLNDDQMKAVQGPIVPTVVLAGPGSGKTRVITHRVVHLLRNVKADPHGIYAVSFTNKASREMHSRVEQLCGEEGAAVSVSTFHALCCKILRRWAHHIDVPNDFDILDGPAQQNLVKRLLLNRAPEFTQTVETKRWFVGAIVGKISAWKNSLKTAAEVPRPREAPSPWEKIDTTAARIYQDYESAKRSASQVDFDDLLLLTHVLLTEKPTIQRRLAGNCRHLLIDEFQDTNTLQWYIAEKLAGLHKSLFVVGDPNQSIYGWRQASLENLSRLYTAFPDAVTVRLSLTYRCTEAILSVAHAVLSSCGGEDQLVERSKADQLSRKPLDTTQGEGDPVHCHIFSTAEDESEFIAERVSALKKEHDAARAEDEEAVPPTVAVLYRIAAISRGIEEALVKRQLPYVMVGGKKFYERAEVKDILAYLRVAHQPNSLEEFARAVAVPPRNIGSSILKNMQQVWSSRGGAKTMSFLDFAEKAARGEVKTPGLGRKGKYNLKQFIDVIRSIQETVQGPLGAPVAAADYQRGPPAGPVSRAIQELMDRIEYSNYLEKQYEKDHKTRKENVFELKAAAQQSEEQLRRERVREEHEKSEDAGAAPLPSPLAYFLERTALGGGQENADEPSDSGSSFYVVLSTIHAAKGLEWDEAILPAVEDDVLPSFMAKKEGHARYMEERRLLYVAITRARARLILSRALFRRFKDNDPCPFLQGLPEEHVQVTSHLDDGDEDVDVDLTCTLKPSSPRRAVAARGRGQRGRGQRGRGQRGARGRGTGRGGGTSPRFPGKGRKVGGGRGQSPPGFRPASKVVSVAAWPPAPSEASSAAHSDSPPTKRRRTAT